MEAFRWNCSELLIARSTWQRWHWEKQRSKSQKTFIKNMVKTAEEYPSMVRSRLSYSFYRLWTQFKLLYYEYVSKVNVSRSYFWVTLFFYLQQTQLVGFCCYTIYDDNNNNMINDCRQFFLNFSIWTLCNKRTRLDGTFTSCFNMINKFFCITTTPMWSHLSFVSYLFCVMLLTLLSERMMSYLIYCLTFDISLYLILLLSLLLK